MSSQCSELESVLPRILEIQIKLNLASFSICEYNW